MRLALVYIALVGLIAVGADALQAPRPFAIVVAVSGAAAAVAALQRWGHGRRRSVEAHDPAGVGVNAAAGEAVDSLQSARPTADVQITDQWPEDVRLTDAAQLQVSNPQVAAAVAALGSALQTAIDAMEHANSHAELELTTWLLPEFLRGDAPRALAQQEVRVAPGTYRTIGIGMGMDHPAASAEEVRRWLEGRVHAPPVSWRDGDARAEALSPATLSRMTGALSTLASEEGELPGDPGRLDDERDFGPHVAWFIGDSVAGDDRYDIVLWEGDLLIVNTSRMVAIRIEWVTHAS